MADYRVTFARSARRELERLDSPTVTRVWSKIEALARNPRPVGCVKLVGPQNLWRIRIGDYRVVYSIDDAARVVDIVTVRHRKDAYR